ncbi:MAG TPA: glycosyltransferase [Bradyrhizobium sp.]|uniref:CgeB family protein n=1 Tax=Bradyrhizobium sp. TaxID=376 RepID=UPI002D81162D|nr:glycosyltransferase [Bradyrhizobium sp.]HET7889734.1 glycosyltransferase [Bradyrhizobium sp.]
MNIAFFGSSLVSSYWNGAATYYRGLLKEIAALGHAVTFFEPDALERQAHRDIDDPDWARVVIYPATSDGWQHSLAQAARSADLVVKASGVGVFDEELDSAIAGLPMRPLRIYWDVDAPATLQAVGENRSHHLRSAVPRYDLVLTYGGGERVISAYRAIGARDCVPIYNALDPRTHFPLQSNSSFAYDLGLLANRLPDREARIEEYFFRAARALPAKRFVLGGSGWDSGRIPANVERLGHVGTGHHNAFFASALATLNVNRASMAEYGFSPPTRIFEAAGAGACLITDAWEGIERFLEPDSEILVAADGEAVAAHLQSLTSARAAEIAGRARRRILAHHTYRQRALQFDRLMEGLNPRTEAAE